MEQQNKSTGKLKPKEKVSLTMEQRMELMKYPQHQANDMAKRMEQGASYEQALKEYEELEMFL